MKALSIMQPWAWLIVNGHKDIENRTWGTRYRGELYIHASKKFDEDGYILVKKLFPHIQMPEKKEFKKGGIVGTSYLVDCVTDDKSEWFSGEFGFVLVDSKPCEFKPCKGALGFFSPEI